VGAGRHFHGFDGRRGFGRAAVVLALCAAAAAGCGKGGHGADTDPEKAADAALLNAALSRELTAAGAYAHGLPLLRGRRRALGRTLRGQDQEYADALTKAIRGVGGEVEAEADELELDGIGDQAEFLTFAYELEGAALAEDIAAAPRLNTAAPRSLAASLAAGHSQHLVVLRQALGDGSVASIPEPFGGDGAPPPGGGPPSGGG
jgi:ribosomal protein S12 methylthiotransferase accessory factor YcaO